MKTVKFYNQLEEVRGIGVIFSHEKNADPMRIFGPVEETVFQLSDTAIKALEKRGVKFRVVDKEELLELKRFDELQSAMEKRDEAKIAEIAASLRLPAI